MHRYKPVLTPDRQGWQILDLVFWSACELPDPDTGEPIELRWHLLDPQGPEKWLAHCYREWGHTPRRDEPHPAPPPGLY